MKKIVYGQDGIWKFWFDAKQGICYLEPGSRQPSVLFEKGQEDFAVNCNEDGVIYLICQDMHNTIYLFYMDRGNWNKKRLLESKNQVFYKKNFQLICVNGWINCFYTIMHQDQTMLIYHVLNSENEPVILETCEREITFFVTQDLENNLYCCYQKNGLGYQKFSWKEKKWGEFVSLYETNEPLASICAIAGYKSDLSVVACFGKDRVYKAVYINGPYSQELIDNSVFQLNPVIFYYKQFYILLELGGRVLQCTSQDGKTFSRPRYYYPGSFSRQQVYQLYFAKDVRQRGLIVSMIYGNEEKGVFEPLLVDECIKNMDFSPIDKPTETEPDIEKYVQEVEKFDEDLQKIHSHLENAPSLDMLMAAVQRIDDLERKVEVLENQLRGSLKPEEKEEKENQS